MSLRCGSLIPFRLLRTCMLASLSMTIATPTPAEPSNKQVFEFLHLWTSPIEQPALQVLKTAIVNVGLTWREHRVKGNFYGVRRELADRLALNVSPAAVFWIGAYERKARLRDDVFRRIDDALRIEDIKRILLPEVFEEVSSSAGMQALPLVVHLQNVAVINEPLFKRLGIASPRSWADFLNAAPVIEAAGVTPLAVSGQRWLFRFLYLSILADGLEPEEFEGLIAATMNRDRFVAIAKRSFETLRALKPYASRDYDSIAWDGAVQKVLDGKAAMTITGDFAAPVIDGVDARCATPPGSGFLMWSFDVMAFPALDDRTAQDLAIGTLATADVLTRFGTAKGGVPVVAGVARSTLDPCSRNSVDRWHAQQKVLLSSESWGKSLNIIASMARLAWTSDSIDLAKFASQMFDEIAESAK